MILDEGLTVNAAAEIVGVSVKTIRRAIADGKLKASKVSGRYGGYRILRGDLLAVWPEGVPDAPRSPLTELSAELAAVKAALDALRGENEQLRAEVRDSRGQINQIHDTLLKALPPPAKPSFWGRFRSKRKEG